MKNTLLILVILANTVSVMATVSVEKLWEKSQTQNNLMEHFATSSLKMQPSFTIYDNAIYLQTRADSVAYKYDVEGNYINAVECPANIRFLDTDANGNLIGFAMANKGKSLTVKYYDEASSSWKEFADTIKGNQEIQNPVFYGSISSKFSVFIFDYGTTKNAKYNIYRYTYQNGALQKIDTWVYEMEFALSQYANIYPTSHDSFFLTVFSNGVYRVQNFANSAYTTLKTPTESKADSLYATGGGQYFSFKGKNYIIVPLYRTGESSLKGLGKFRIYDVTTGFTRIFQSNEVLGNDNDVLSSDFYLNPTRIVTKEDGVYIYLMSPYNGMKAYKLSDDSPYIPTEVETTTKKNFDYFVNNSTMYIQSEVGANISIYSTDGRILATTTAVTEITSFNNLQSKIVVVKVDNQAKIVALQ